MHFLTGRADEKLTFDLQPDLAARLGSASTSTRSRPAPNWWEYGKQVEIAGAVTLMPGVYYFTEGFRAVNGGSITGTGVTLMFDQSKTIDVAQSVPWRIKAPTTGATKGIAMMGDPTKTSSGDVRLIGIMGNVEGAVYFPNQRLLTEAGPNTTPALCTTIVAKTIDIRGSGTINNDCTNASGSTAGGVKKVRLVKAAPA